MTDQGSFSNRKSLILFLSLIFLASLLLKLANIKVGAPFVTIDDKTTFQGGFMVWFGNAQPQRMYLESWLCGVTSLITYVGKVMAGQTTTGLNSNLVAEAYQDYYGAPDIYAQVYRAFVLLLDMVTAWFVYRLGLLVLGKMWKGWAAALAAAMYLFSYNTVWCDVVARPDVLVGVFTTIGLYFYYKSDFGEQRSFFWLAAVFLGLGAGLKLHACLFVVFIALDLLRVHGWRKGFPLAIPMVVVAIVFFALAAGMPLFDPLKYVKLRMLNVKDDESPWIKWGEQFYAILKGSGWAVVPLVLLGVVQRISKRELNISDRKFSVTFLAVCWILLFASIRQLRPYWMLPALPLFYIAFLSAMNQLKDIRIRSSIMALVFLIMVAETVIQVQSFHQINYNNLRQWIQQNIEPDEPFYIYGYEAVELPKTFACQETIKTGIQRGFAEDIKAGETHVMRHLKNWEESSTLMLLDMLSGRKDNGFAYYSVFGAPLEKFEGILDLDQMKYVFVQEGFDPREYGVAPDYLENNFKLEADLVGPGGGGRGLKYKVYIRKMES